MKISFALSKKQTIACDYLENELVEEVLYGGAKGGGKSIFLCIYAVLYAQWVIVKCKIKKQEHTPVIGFLGRKRGVDFSKTTLETWKKIIPAEIYKINEQKKEITLFELVRYHIGGLDDEENIKKFNSAEYGLVAIDQAEELDRDDAGMLRGTQARASVNGIPLPIKTLWTANPGECFLEEDFGLKEGFVIPDNRKFVQALPSDNEFIDSQKYVFRLREAWKHHPELIAAYVEGIWGTLRDGNFLLERSKCEEAQRLTLIENLNTKKIVTIDPAWLGEKTDEIASYVITEQKVIDSYFRYNQDTIKTAAENVKLYQQYEADGLVVDAIGIGVGVVDNCKALKAITYPINSGRACDDEIDDKNIKTEEKNKIRFLNIRAEMWWKGSEKINSGKFILPNDPELINQLCAVKYEIRNGKIKIEDKAEIKKRIGRSPDRADALIQGIWAIDNVKKREKLNNFQRVNPWKGGSGYGR